MIVKVAFDKGHGGDKPNIYYDPGAVGNGLQEATLTCKICDYAIAELSKYDGVAINVMPRPSSKVASQRLNPRPDAAKAWGADLFVSFHINADGDGKDETGTGFETFLFTTPNKERRVTTIIHDELSEYFTKTLGLRDRGQKLANLAVLRRSSAQMPAILIEYGFIDNKNDAKFLKIEQRLKEMGIITAQAIAKAYNLKLKTSVKPVPVKNDEPASCKVVIGDRELSTPGIMVDGRSYLPIRAISDVTGASLTWVESTIPALKGNALKTYYNYKGTGYAHSVEIAKALGREYSWNNTKNILTII